MAQVKSRGRKIIGKQENVTTPLPRLKVSDNHRFLSSEDASPFFFQGDTAWELFHRQTIEEADEYLRDRASKKYNVIQAVILSEFDGLHTPNAYGNLPLLDGDPAKPNLKYFAHVDQVVDHANSLGMYVGLLPTWGSWWQLPLGNGGIFTPQNAEIYGRFLGQRYQQAGIIWILGGDRRIEQPRHFEIIRALARGLKAGDGGSHLIACHPPGGHSSAETVHTEPWLDFNLNQSGHTGRDNRNWQMTTEDLARLPLKPTLDDEANYEHHPVMCTRDGRWEPVDANQWFDQHDVRKTIYWSLLAGACGYTYGCHDVWQFYQPGKPGINHASLPWRQAIQLPGAGQVQHARALMESRPYFTRIPDQSLLASPAGIGGEHLQAARGSESDYAFIYLPLGKPVTIHMQKITGPAVRASWFDPRSGQLQGFGEFANQGQREFTPPSSGLGNDWVLVLDDAKK